MQEFIFPCVDVAGVMVPEHRYAELEEIVRCRECARRKTYIICDEERHGCSEMRGFCYDNDYCSKGVRK